MRHTVYRVIVFDRLLEVYRGRKNIFWKFGYIDPHFVILNGMAAFFILILDSTENLKVLSLKVLYT